MSIEPQNARFQIGTIVMPAVSKTLEDYRDNLRRKYGKVPSLRELAGRENKTVSRSLNIDETSKEPMNEADAKRILSLRKAAAAKTRATLNMIISHLTKPKTAAELEIDCKLSRQAIGAHLRAAYDRGEVDRVVIKRVTLWSKTP